MYIGAKVKCTCFHRYVHFTCVSIYIFSFYQKQCASNQKDLTFVKFTTQLFSSIDQSLKGEIHLLLLLVGSLVTRYTFVFSHLASVVKPVHIFMARSRVSKSHLKVELCFLPERQKEKERDRERERETETQRDTQRERHTDRERERERETERDRDRETERQRDRERQTERETERDKERHRERQRDRERETFIEGLFINKTHLIKTKSSSGFQTLLPLMKY